MTDPAKMPSRRDTATEKAAEEARKLCPAKYHSDNHIDCGCKKIARVLRHSKLELYRALDSLRDASTKLTAAHEQLAKEERAHLDTITDRDRFEEAIGTAVARLGCEKEWSNCHDHAQCLLGAATAAHERIAVLEGALDKCRPDEHHEDCERGWDRRLSRSIATFSTRIVGKLDY